MKRIIKIVLFCYLFFYSFLASAQVDEYLDSEKIRITQAESVESEIASFISNNWSSYSLSESKIDELMLSLSTDSSSEALSQEGINELLIGLKKDELRKLYLEQNPDKLLFFFPLSKSESLRQTCINGGFENDYANYTFKKFLHYGTLSGAQISPCTVILPNQNAFTPTGLNQFQNNVTLVNPGNEPLLAALNVIVNRVRTGNRALKINPTPANVSDAQINGDITSVSRDFIVNENEIEFNFMFIGTVADHYGQPTFSYKLIDRITNVVLRNICIQIDQNDCRFNHIPDTRPGWAGTGTIVAYSGWICERINTSDLLGRDVRLEFTVSDCENRGHYGTAYIDDICGGVTCTPTSTWGNINLTPLNINCPVGPFNICGTFELPAGTTLAGLQLFGSNGIGNVNVVPVITGNSFCYTVDPSVFYNGVTDPLGNYNFHVVANLTNQCSFVSEIQTVTFNNCCFANLTETMSVQGNKQRDEWIAISGGVPSYSRAIRHAGNYIELNPGFITFNEAEFSGYIFRCDNWFTYKNDEADVKETAFDDSSIKLIKNKINIYPNPTNSYFTVNYAAEKFNRVIITSMEGRVILNQKIEAANSYQLDISNYKTGIYTLSVQTNDGNTITDKLIKN